MVAIDHDGNTRSPFHSISARSVMALGQSWGARNAFLPQPSGALEIGCRWTGPLRVVASSAIKLDRPHENQQTCPDLTAHAKPSFLLAPPHLF